MAASATVRPHSSSSSASSTPWLSPEASSCTWRTSSTSSSNFSHHSSPGPVSFSFNTMDSATLPPRDPHSQEWWEHILPPGQLAERLRKAQRSSSASRRRNNPALAHATPSERSAWKRLSGLPTEQRQQDQSESSTAASSRRSSFHAGTSATLPRSALKSSHRSHDAASLKHAHAHQSESSLADGSSDEFGGASTGQHTPQHHIRFAFPTAEERDFSSTRRPGVRTTANSPEMVSSCTWSESTSVTDASDSGHTFSRSTSGRRMRVMSEDGIASSLFASSQSSSSCHRIPVSHSAVHLGKYATGANNPSTWTSLAADQSAPSKYANHALPDTPELSSDDSADVTKFSTTTAQRVRKSSTTRTTLRCSSWTTTAKLASAPTIAHTHADRRRAPACSVSVEDADAYVGPANRRDRHVSFDQATRIHQQPTVEDYPEPLSSSQSALNFGTTFDSLPPRSNSTRRARQGVRASARRTTSFSLPNSRRGSLREDSAFQHAGTRTGGAAPSAGARAQQHRRSSSVPDAVLLESLNVAHKQLASAGNLALALTRQLSAPLRPVLHMTLFLSISSITVLSLACFLCASYMLTAWDDVSERTQRVGAVAGRTRHRFGTTLDWGLRMLAVDVGSSASASASTSTNSEARHQPSVPNQRRFASTSRSSDTHTRRAAVLAARHVIFWPARLAFSATTMVAHTITPPSISNMFAKSHQPKPKRTSSLPPRPPLSTLVPSILFTLVLAIGAGLTSFLASRNAAAQAQAQPQSDAPPRESRLHPHTPHTNAYSVPEYPHLASTTPVAPNMHASLDRAHPAHRARLTPQC